MTQTQEQQKQKPKHKTELTREQYLDCFIKDCNKYLFNQSSGESLIARNYLKDRGFKNETINFHKVGYCPRNKFVDSILWDDGSSKDGPKSLYNFIRGHIIVPIYDEFGEPTALATRKPSKEKGNSWWNLPFKKGNHIYLFSKSREFVFNKNKIYLLEGYVDGLILYQEGLKEVGVLMGTKFTLRMVGLIARYCDSVCVCMDTDENESGQYARNKIIDTLHTIGSCSTISVINLPLKVDPDEYVLKNGLKQFLSLEETLTKDQLNKIHQEVKDSK